MQNRTEFHTRCLQLMHPLHAAQIANLFVCTIDELIDDAYAGEIDDLNDSTPESFSDWIDSMYARI